MNEAIIVVILVGLPLITSIVKNKKINHQVLWKMSFFLFVGYIILSIRLFRMMLVTAMSLGGDMPEDARLDSFIGILESSVCDYSWVLILAIIFLYSSMLLEIFNGTGSAERNGVSACIKTSSDQQRNKQ